MSVSQTSTGTPQNVAPTTPPERLLCLSNNINHNFSNGVRIHITTDYFEDDFFGEFETSDQRKVQNSEDLTYKLRCYTAGDAERNRGFISVYVEVSSRKPETYIVSAAIRVVGDDRTKTFHFVANESYAVYIPQFMSHAYVRERGLATDGSLTIECTATCQPLKYCAATVAE